MATEESFNCDRSCYRSRGMMNDKLLETNWNFHLCCAQRHTYTRALIRSIFDYRISSIARREKRKSSSVHKWNWIYGL